MATKLLLDTDIGSDIDDAVALAWLLANPACDLLGITTVTGEARERAMIASAVCRAAGRTVPIFPGTEAPLLGAQRQPRAPHAAALPRWPHEESFPEGRAIAFLADTIAKHPGEVVLLAIGPLTNVALLFAEHPAAARQLKALVLMCGIFGNEAPGFGPREWNAMLDPTATAIVYTAPVGVHRSIGLDVTSRVTLPLTEVKARFRSPRLAPVVDMAEIWFRHSDRMIFHDPLAAVSIFEPSVCTFQRGRVDVELASPRLAGATLWTRDDAGHHEAAFGVDASRFFQAWFSLFE
jgi:purine nucleosidase